VQTSFNDRRGRHGSPTWHLETAGGRLLSVPDELRAVPGCGAAVLGAVLLPPDTSVGMYAATTPARSIRIAALGGRTVVTPGRTHPVGAWRHVPLTDRAALHAGQAVRGYQDTRGEARLGGVPVLKPQEIPTPCVERFEFGGAPEPVADDGGRRRRPPLLTDVRDNLRHSSLATTLMYLHSDNIKRARQTTIELSILRVEATTTAAQHHPINAPLRRPLRDELACALAAAKSFGHSGAQPQDDIGQRGLQRLRQLLGGCQRGDRRGPHDFTHAVAFERRRPGAPLLHAVLPEKLHGKDSLHA
jgi:hypothetical protein